MSSSYRTSYSESNTKTARLLDPTTSDSFPNEQTPSIPSTTSSFCGRIKWRIIISCLLSLCNVCLYIARANISVGVVYMFPNDPATKDFVLAAFYWGYLVSQIPGGWLVQRFGGFKVLFFTVFCWNIATIGCALFGNDRNILFLFRFIVGMSEGLNYPAQVTIVSKWIPTNERSRAWAFLSAGEPVGTIIALFVCPYLYYDTGSWQWIFWFSVLIGFVWLLLFVVLASDSPDTHRWISKEERVLIETYRPSEKKGERSNVPWRAIFTCGPFYALIVTHICYNWGYYVVLSWLPTFFTDRFQLDFQDLGIVSAAPYIGLFFVSNFAGWMCDALERKCTTEVMRKFTNTLGMVVPAMCYFLLSALPSHWVNEQVSLILITCGVSFGGFALSGYWNNFMDLSPKYSGQLLGISNSLASLPGIVGNYVTGFILTASNVQSDSQKWDIVFFVGFCIYLFGANIFVWFAKGHVQKFDAL